MVTSLLDGNFFAAVSSDKVTNYSPTITGEPNNGYIGGASALATELPNNEIMVKPSVGRSKEFITRLITILLMLKFRERSIFGVDEKVKKTLIFNTFVLCQVFNEFNARKLEKKNIFKVKELFKNKLLLLIIGFTISSSTGDGVSDSTERLNLG
jgi:Ca2+-transporting ATPase